MEQMPKRKYKFFGLGKPEATLNAKVKSLIYSFNKNETYEYRQQALEYLSAISDDLIGIYDFGNEDITCGTVTKIIQKNKEFNFTMSFAKVLYTQIVRDFSNIEQKQLYFQFLDLYLKNKIYFQDRNNLNSIFTMFGNKQILLSLFNFFIENNYPSENVESIMEYIKSARRYYVDENALYSAVIKLVEGTLLCFGNEAELKKQVNAAIVKDKQASGIYDDLDEIKLASLAFLANKIDKDISGLEIKSKNIELMLSGILTEVDEKINNLVSKTTESYETTYKSAMESLGRLVTTAETLGGEQEQLIKKIGEKYVNLITGFLKANPKIKAKIENAELEKAIYSGVVSRFFDENIPFKDRYKDCLKTKPTDELYHASFDKILKEVLMNNPVYIPGPSGGGKTHIVKQISRLLGLPMINLGFITDEFASIKGYNDVRGEFVKTPFYNAYKNGGILLIEELDNSASKALIELNKIISGDGYEPYLFPNGDLVYPHPNFRIIATGNTWGDGANSAYNAREKQDGATMNRFSMIFYGYDPQIEKIILANQSDMYKFSVAFREVLQDGSYDDVLSTRDMAKIKEYLDTECYTIEEILDIKMIKNKRKEVLVSMFKKMKDKNLSEENEVLITFSKMIENVDAFRRNL